MDVYSDYPCLPRSHVSSATASASARAKALAVKRAQGVRLGRPSTLPSEIVARIVAERDAGSSLRAIADGLTRDGVATAQGGRAWYASTVRKVLASQQANATFEPVAR
jgi:hypothetical protein